MAKHTMFADDDPENISSCLDTPDQAGIGGKPYAANPRIFEPYLICFGIVGIRPSQGEQSSFILASIRKRLKWGETTEGQ